MESSSPGRIRCGYFTVDSTSVIAVSDVIVRVRGVVRFENLFVCDVDLIGGHGTSKGYH